MRQLLLMVVCLCYSYGLAAQYTITGTVKDTETNESLAGVGISVDGTTTGTVTNIDGEYRLQVPDEQGVLVFRYIGYADQQVPYSGVGMLNVLLTSQSETLDEVVVTALGLERQTKDLGYAIQSLDGELVSEVKSPNFLDNLGGRIAGVTVNQGATGVGSSTSIVIRGESSFTNNNPLFVVDGIPINNNSIINVTNDAAAGFQEVDFGNGAMEVNPDDIASISVLKGPSAAALYGTRASNGVILIQTKDGGKQKGLGIEFNTSTFVETPFQLPRFQNTYGQGNSGEFEFVDGLGGGVNDNITYSYGPQLDQGILIPQFDSPVTLADGTVVRGGDVAVHGGAPITATEFVSHPDNLKNFYETGVTSINNLAISSGFDRGNYRLSYTDLRSDGVIPGVNLNRQTVSSRLTFQPANRLRISSAINYVHSASDNRPANGYGSENVNYSLVAWGPRSLDIGALEDYWQPGLEGVQQYSFNYTFFDNPYFILLENRNSFDRDRLFGNVSLTYDITDNLSVLFRSGMDYSDELRQFRRNFSSNRFSSGAYAEHTVAFRENNTDILLNYSNRFGLFSLDISAGANRMDQVGSTVQTQALSLAQPGIFKLSNAASPLEIFEFESRKRINSVYGLAKLGFKDFLFVDITGRNDWSSALATPISTANTSFFYPSISGSLILSELFDMPGPFSFAKLRANYAQVGNDTDPFQTNGVFLARTPFNAQPTFSDQSAIANAGLLPERTTSVEFGADLRFYDDRLNLDFTWYNAMTENQIISLPIPVSSGYTEQVVNGGAVRSTGIELMLGVTPILKPGFVWNAQVNYSRNISTLESAPEGIDRLTLAYNRVYDNVNQTVWFQVEPGGRIGDMYGTGYLKTEDGDFILDDEGNYIVDNTLIKLGNYNPDFIVGMSNQFMIRNFQVQFLLEWRQGGILVSRTQALAGVAGQLEETENRPEEGIIAEGVVNVGSAENPEYVPNTNAINAESYYRQYYDRNHEENNTYDASYLKLREVSIGYTFKGENGFFSDGRSLQLALIGRNLFAFSEIPHFDPEQLAVQGPQFVRGVEDMSYASTRSFGLKLGFKF
ncbi:MAG: SusC/RagA family TonB-linked outer membrane protein [Bacteroidetes bacterium]|nr:SusC/RagA family TonB-linked outer membrane protein [Bacteroidota bacterium]